MKIWKYMLICALILPVALLRAEMVGYWKFDNTTDLGEDSSAYYNDGIVTGAVNSTDAAAGSRSLYFDTSTDVFQMYTCDQFNGDFTDGLATLTMWVKLNTATAETGLGNIGCWASPTFYPAASGTAYFNTFLQYESQIPVTLRSDTHRGAWHFLAVAVDSLDTAAGYKIFQNGNLTASFAMNGSYGNFRGPETPRLGYVFDQGAGWNAYESILGKVDDVKIFNSCLPQEVIKLIMADWDLLTFDTFEGGDWGHFFDKGGDCMVHRGLSESKNGQWYAKLRNDSTSSYLEMNQDINLDTPNYKSLKVGFWFKGYACAGTDNFVLQYYNGSIWQNVKTYTYGSAPFLANNTYYYDEVTLNEGTYTFPSAAKIRFELNAPNSHAVNFDAVSVAASNWTELAYDNFETGTFGNYFDAGTDCSLLYEAGTPVYCYDGHYSARIRDNTSTSKIELTNGIDVATPNYTQIKVECYFKGHSMETGEDFWIQYFDGTAWSTIQGLARDTNFTNEEFHYGRAFISETNKTFPSNMKIRFQNDSSDDDDSIYLDCIRISAR